MNLAPRRPLLLMDAIVLIAATAVGMGAARALHAPLRAHTDMTVRTGPAGVALLEVARWIALGLPFLASWTVALLLCGMMRSPSGLRRKFGRPGMAACGAAALGLAVDAANLLLLLILVAMTVRNGLSWELLLDAFLESIDFGFPNFAAPGLAVLVAWLSLAIGGRWRPEPSWLDRAGRLIGSAWIGLTAGWPWVRACLAGALT